MLKVTVISDIHIGAYGSKKNKFLDLLRHLKTDHLILNGDIYDLYLGKPKIDIFPIIKSSFLYCKSSD